MKTQSDRVKPLSEKWACHGKLKIICSQRYVHKLIAQEHVNVILFGKMCFFLQMYELNDIKVRRLFWIIFAGSKCHSKCPYKRQAEGDQIHREEEAIQKWRQKLEWCGHKPGDMSHQGVKEAWTGFSPRFRRVSMALLMLSIFDFSSLWF